MRLSSGFRLIPFCCAVGVVLILFLAGCSGSNLQTNQPPPPPPPVSPPPLQITSTTLPNGEVEKAYQATLAATGGTPPYTWEITSGTLPPGLALAASGVISGTPTQAGTFPTSFRAQDSATPTPAATAVTFAMNVVPPPPPPPAPGPGIWISPEEVRALPMSGPAWENVKKEADRASCGTVRLSNQDDDTNVCILAKALVYARTGIASYRTAVEGAITQIVSAGTYNGRALALGRELAAYVIAADLVDLRANNALLDAEFRAKLQALRTTHTKDGPDNLVLCHEERPNNWGTMCGGSRVAVAAYLGDQAELARAAQVFKGFLGDRSSYAEFRFGSDDQNAISWSSLPSNEMVPVNPKGATIQGRNVDGALIDDISRGGAFQWPPIVTQYPWEGLAGAIVEAEILCRNGYPDVYERQDQALRRSYEYLLYLHMQFGSWFDSGTTSGDDNWQPWIANLRYGINLPNVTPTRPGKQMGWADWTHAPGTRSPSCAVVKK